jgi:hypothetical protein
VISSFCPLILVWYVFFDVVMGDGRRKKGTRNTRTQCALLFVCFRLVCFVLV